MTRSSRVTSTFESPLGVTKIDSSGRRRRRSRPARPPIRAHRGGGRPGRCPARWFPIESAVTPRRGARTRPATIVARTRPRSVFPGVRRVASLRAKARRIHDHSTSGANTGDVGRRPPPERAAREMKHPSRRARHSLDERRQSMIPLATSQVMFTASAVSSR
jgi:hypothetical protein